MQALDVLLLGVRVEAGRLESEMARPCLMRTSSSTSVKVP